METPNDPTLRARLVQHFHSGRLPEIECSHSDAVRPCEDEADALLPIVEQYAAERVVEVEGSFRVGGREVTRTDYLALTDALEYGDDGYQSPAAHPRDLIDPLQQAMSEARDHYECPVICELCGETLARTICEHCNGSGCGPGTAGLAYEECGWCAGVGRIHQGCAEQSYADLVVRAESAEQERDEAVSRLAANQKAYIKSRRSICEDRDAFKARAEALEDKLNEVRELALRATLDKGQEIGRKRWLNDREYLIEKLSPSDVLDDYIESVTCPSCGIQVDPEDPDHRQHLEAFKASVEVGDGVD